MQGQVVLGAFASVTFGTMALKVTRSKKDEVVITLSGGIEPDAL